MNRLYELQMVNEGRKVEVACPICERLVKTECNQPVACSCGNYLFWKHQVTDLSTGITMFRSRWTSETPAELMAEYKNQPHFKKLVESLKDRPDFKEQMEDFDKRLKRKFSY